MPARGSHGRGEARAGVLGAPRRSTPLGSDAASTRRDRGSMMRNPGAPQSPDPPLGIVLVEPEIPGNTGSIGRLAMACRCPLHLVGRLGVQVDDHPLRRAGLDYWPQADIYYHESLATLYADLGAPRLHLLSTRGARPHTAIPFRRGDLIVFGRE